MIKKTIVVVSIIGTLAGSAALVDYFVDDMDLYGNVMSIVKKVEGDQYTGDNLGSFKSIKVKGNLKASETVPEVVATTRVISGNILITVPLYTSNVRDTFNETVFATDGSFYIALRRDENITNNNSTFEMKLHELGRSAPKVIEAKVPNTNITLYIQCYTPEALAFFTSGHMNSLRYETVRLDFSKTTDEVASTVSINTSLYPKKEDMKLEDAYIDVVAKHSKDIEGYSDFIEYEDKYLIYYKAIGFLDTRMKVEYAKLTAMGYTPIEAGTYKDISYIKFNELTVLGFSLTKNSSLIYHVSNLK